MANATVIADRRFVTLILQQLSDMKWRDRVQPSPEQRVELHEYRPTLVPSILVNKLWADVGRSILWKRYPPLPCLKQIAQHRQQEYANMIEHFLMFQPFSEEYGDFAFLANLKWSNLKSLKLDLDWERYGLHLETSLKSGLENIELVDPQQTDTLHVANSPLHTLFRSCEKLQSIHLSANTIDPANPLYAHSLIDVLETRQNMKSIRLFEVSVLEKDHLFKHLSQGFDQLEELQLDLEPGLQLLPMLKQRPSTFFPRLKRLRIMCYPEIALLLPSLLPLSEDLHIDITRIPDQPASGSDLSILNDLITQVNHCPRLRSLRLDIGPLAIDFPSSDIIPNLSGAVLKRLGKSCPHLEYLALSASEPAAIDATGISSSDFDTFCRLVKNLEHLSLKLDPVTAAHLEDVALSSLSRHCSKLEVLRIRAPLRLESPDEIELSKPTLETAHETIEPHRPTAPPSFAHLTHLALSRPNTILSRTSSPVDPAVAADLVQPFASSLLTYFPQLEILEAWSDYLGADKDSLNYFFPLREPLASSWEFLSGREQNLYEDDEDVDEDEGFQSEKFVVGRGTFGDHGMDEREVERWDAVFDEGETSFESETSGDWDLASRMNEFPETTSRMGLDVGDRHWEGLDQATALALEDSASAELVGIQLNPMYKHT